MRAKSEGRSNRAKESIRMISAPARRAQNMAKNIAPAPVVISMAGRSRRMIMADSRSEEHTSELQSLMRISYAVFCLKKKKTTKKYTHIHTERHNQSIYNNKTYISM